MTTIPGHNVVIQQSGVAQEAAQSATSPKPDPEQAAAQQQIKNLEKGTTVQQFDESEKVKTRDEKNQDQQKRKKRELEMKKKEAAKEDPDAPGKLLDTII